MTPDEHEDLYLIAAIAATMLIITIVGLLGWRVMVGPLPW